MLEPIRINMIFTLYNVNYVAPRSNTAGRETTRTHVHILYIYSTYISSMYTVCKCINTMKKMIKSILVKNRDMMYDTLRQAHKQRDTFTLTVLHGYTSTHYTYTFTHLHTSKRHLDT